MGVISEADILYKEHDPLAGPPGGPLAWIVDGSRPTTAVAKARARPRGRR